MRVRRAICIRAQNVRMFARHAQVPRRQKRAPRDDKRSPNYKRRDYTMPGRKPGGLFAA